MEGMVQVMKTEKNKMDLYSVLIYKEGDGMMDVQD